MLHCSANQNQTKKRKFVSLTSLSPGSNKLSISNSLPTGAVKVKSLELDSDHEEHLVVDEPRALKSGGRTAKPPTPLESGPLKLKLAGMSAYLGLVNFQKSVQACMANGPLL
jgi:hypothetical protein